MMLSNLTATRPLDGSRRRCRAAWFLVIMAFAIVVVGTAVRKADAAMYLNSRESMCNGSDSTVLMCDDFENGRWYVTDCDTSGGISNADNDGWCGTIYANPITPPGAAVCGGKGAGGTSCAASSGQHTGGAGGGNMADHNFVNQQKVDEVYVRYYYKADPGYMWGAQKALTFNQYAGSGGIAYGNFSFNCAIGAPSSTAYLTMGFPVPEDMCQSQNVGNNITIQSGRWYLFEIHMKLNTPVDQPDGVFELWVDDCGTNGLGCTGPQTLRMRRTNVKYPRSSTSDLIGSMWWENWANPGSTGTEYYDQIVVRTKPIGPVGAVSSASGPSAPTNLQAQ